MGFLTDLAHEKTNRLFNGLNEFLELHSMTDGYPPEVVSREFVADYCRLVEFGEYLLVQPDHVCTHSDEWVWFCEDMLFVRNSFIDLRAYVLDLTMAFIGELDQALIMSEIQKHLLLLAESIKRQMRNESR